MKVIRCKRVFAGQSFIIYKTMRIIGTKVDGKTLWPHQFPDWMKETAADEYAH